MEKMLTVEMQIAERARKYRSEALTNLHEFIDVPLLQESFNTLNRRLNSYYYQTKRLLHNWLNHCGGKRVWSWEKVKKLTEE